jgi:hypothetical protein
MASAAAAAAAAAGGSEHHWPGPPDAPAPGATHKRTRSSNTQLPSLDEHTVLSEPGWAGNLQPATTAAGAQVLTLPTADALSLQAMGSGGLPGYHSRRSSRADSEISSGADSAAGGLVCEPSSFGVCADPAGEFLVSRSPCHVVSKRRGANKLFASSGSLAGMIKACYSQGNVATLSCAVLCCRRCAPCDASHP